MRLTSGARRSREGLDFVRDSRGQALRQYVLAVALAAVLVVFTFTLLAERIYLVVLQFLGAAR